jgi:putative MFS transporter
VTRKPHVQDTYAHFKQKCLISIKSRLTDEAERRSKSTVEFRPERGDHRGMKVTIEQTLDQAGAGPFQRNLLGVFGLVWAADAMQVLAVGFTAASIAATFGLTVPQALQTGTLFFFGMLIGAALFGRLADKYGRRRVLLITVACDAVFGLLSAFSPNFAILLGLRFLTGIAVGGTLPVDYAMMAEFLPSKNRGRWLVMLEGFWAVGTVIIALAAWAASLAGVADAWR